MKTRKQNDTSYIKKENLKLWIKTEDIHSVKEFKKKSVEYNRMHPELPIPGSEKIIYRVYKETIGELIGIKGSGIYRFLTEGEFKTWIKNENITSLKVLIEKIREFNNNHKDLKIPSTSRSVLKIYGKCYGEFLGTWKRNKKSLMCISDLKQWVKDNNISTTTEYIKEASKFNKTNETVYIPCSSNQFKRLYKITIGELLEKNICRSGRKTFTLEEIREFIKKENINSEQEFIEKAKTYNSTNTDKYIPYSKSFFKTNGTTLLKEITGYVKLDKNSKYFRFYTLEETQNWIIEQNISNIKEFYEKAREFNENNDSVKIPQSRESIYSNYGIYPRKLFNKKFKKSILIEGEKYLTIDELYEWIEDNQISSGLEFIEKAKEFNNTQDIKRITYNNIVLKKIYGKTLGEILNLKRSGRREGPLITKKVFLQKLSLHLEDLVLLDKTQLLQIAFLKKLPKDIYKEIIECPKGEKRRQLLEELPDKLEAIKEDDKKTFEDSLEDAIEATENIQESEEKKFRDDLKTGIDLAEKPGRFNPEEKIKEIFDGISALDNFKDGDYDGPEAIEYLVCSEIQKLWNIAIRTSYHGMQKLIEEYMLKKKGSKFFNEVTSIFLRQYQAVQEFKVPEGYSFPYEQLMMQKLTALMISERRQFANWSETGSGKTISGVLTSRYIGSKITLVIAVNSTISNWTENAIRQAYPDSKVYTKKHISEETKLDTNFYNYIVVNYEEFQNPDKYVTKWKPFLENNKVGLVILDEVQLVKVKTVATISNRRKVIDNVLQDIDLQHGRDLEKEGRVVPVLALSATPVINSLNEVLSLLSLLTGVEFNPVMRTTRRSALGCHFELTKRGIRLAEELPAKERLITFSIKRDFKDLSDISGINILNKIDTSSCLMKIGKCIENGYLQKGVKTIVYTDLVTNVIDNITKYLQISGLKVGEFTGRNEKTRYQDMNDFINGDLDVLIASKPISTGVDGLQKVCNRIIILIPAWTYAEYHQLVGRINRKGTVFDEVEIIIPTVEFVKNYNCEEYIKDVYESWSLDIERLARIRFKKSLADVTINGEIPEDVITDEQALKLAKKSLTEFLKNNKTYKSSAEIPIIANEIKPTGKVRVRGNRNRRDYWSELQDFNQLISASTTEHIFTNVIKSKEDWLKYHELREKSMEDIKNQPIYTIARDFLKSGRPKVLGDMGCGMNQLKTLLPKNYKVISVDWYAADETVKVCNLQDTSSIIGDGELDIAVYSLSFWGKDWRKGLKDADRIRDYDGKIIIAQPRRSEARSIEKVEKALVDSGFINIVVTKDAIGKYYYMTATK